MSIRSAHGSPILVTGAAGEIGAIGRHPTAMLLAYAHILSDADRSRSLGDHRQG